MAQQGNGTPAPDPVELKMAAHETAVAAARAVMTMIDMQLKRVRDFNGEHQGAAGSTLNPTRGVETTLRTLRQQLEPQVRRTVERARNFEQSNFEVDEAPAPGD